MSTFSISTSGVRAVTTTLGDPSYTGASISARVGDSAAINGNSFANVKTLLLDSAKIRRVRVPQRSYDYETKEWSDAGTRDYYEVSLGNGFLLICEGGTSTPHVSLNVRKDLEAAGSFSLLDKGEMLDELTLGELYERAS